MSNKKEQAWKWIEIRILAEKNKHENMGNNEWAKIAAIKINSEIFAQIQQAYQEGFDKANELMSFAMKKVNKSQGWEEEIQEEFELGSPDKIKAIIRQLLQKSYQDGYAKCKKELLELNNLEDWVIQKARQEERDKVGQEMFKVAYEKGFNDGNNKALEKVGTMTQAYQDGYEKGYKDGQKSRNQELFEATSKLQ